MQVRKHHFLSFQNLFLLFVALFIRLPFFFRDYMDRDESTFILVGQSVADGHLPYDVLWDLKPPLLFYFFGLVEWIFPHSLIAIRIFGLLIIFFSALLLNGIAKETGLKNGFWIALGYIILSSLFGSLQGVMSEHIAVFFLLSGLYYFVKTKTTINGIISGIAFGCAILCKLNYAYAVLAFIICYFFIHYRKLPFGTLFRHLLFPSLGLLLSFFLISLPYWAHGKLTLLVDSALRASMEYGHTNAVSWLGKLEATWWMILASIVIICFSVKKTKGKDREPVLLCAALLLGTVYTFFSSATINGHYLIQVFPFLLILIPGVIINREFRPRFLLLTLFILAISFESITEYYKVAYHYAQHRSLYNGRAFLVTDELHKRQLQSKKIFYTSYHLGYWLLDQYPLTKSSTHPSSLARPFLFKYMGTESKSSLEELQYIMEELQPEIIVSSDHHLYFFAPQGPENQYFKKKIMESFRLIFEDSKKKVVIWERVGG